VKKNLKLKKIKLNIHSLVGKGYNRFWTFKGRYRAVKGSRASKKSKTTALWFIYHMMKHPQANTLVVRKTYRTLKDSCFTELKWAVKRLNVEHLWHFKESPLEAEYIPTAENRRLIEKINALDTAADGQDDPHFFDDLIARYQRGEYF
jgi:phage terminase large subunit